MPSISLSFFDIWRPGYAGKVVNIYLAGTTTLASVYTDEALTVAADNPQTLDSLSLEGITYGRWAEPLYVGASVELEIDGWRTGIIRPPVSNLSGVDASEATVRAASGSRDIALEDILDRVVYATDYGTLTAGAGNASTNTTTLTSAIGVASANGGGYVLMPEGTWYFNQLTVPTGVVLMGQGRGVTILTSETLDKCVTLSGDRSGLKRLTLDGVDLGTGSIGLYSKANDETAIDDVEIKRFDTGVHFKGGRRNDWRELYITNCAVGAKLHGDTDAGGGADGDAFRNNRWIGGVVKQCTTTGVDLSYEDALCIGNRIQAGFLDNTGTALKINGARYTDMSGSFALGNTGLLNLDDDDDTDATDFNTVIGFHWSGGTLEDGTITFDGTCQDVIIEKAELKDVDITLSTPLNHVLVLDCTEDSQVTVAGDGKKWIRRRTTQDGEVSAVTTDNVATAIWSYTVDPGERLFVEAKVVARQRNGTDSSFYWVAAGVIRPGSTLAYASQTANFSAGSILTGGTSGATARITADSDSGTTGTLTLQDIEGVFEIGEIIADDAGGSATCNGTLTAQNVALDGTGVSNIRAATETDADYACTLAVDTASQTIRLNVTGDTSETVEWTGRVSFVQIG